MLFPVHSACVLSLQSRGLLCGRHPDKNPHTDSSGAFAVVAEAYEVWRSTSYLLTPPTESLLHYHVRCFWEHMEALSYARWPTRLRRAHADMLRF